MKWQLLSEISFLVSINKNGFKQKYRIKLLEDITLIFTLFIKQNIPIDERHKQIKIQSNVFKQMNI